MISREQIGKIIQESVNRGIDKHLRGGGILRAEHHFCFASA